MKNAEYNRQQMHTNILELWLENGTGGITMDVREKLVELLINTIGLTPTDAEIYANDFIAHGVTVQEDCKDCAEATQNCIVKLQEQIAELRSAQELDGCEYCKEDREGFIRMFGAFSITNPFHGNEWFINTGHCKPRQIFFCPMCGRKLPQPPKGE